MITYLIFLFVSRLSVKIGGFFMSQSQCVRCFSL
nr:MAG TPA: hypothetical protein [Caudoviricetes sp.]